MATKKTAPSNRTPQMSAEERRWRAESDANTLARAQEIMADKMRHKAAQTHASKEAERYGRVAKPSPGGRNAARKR